MQKEMLVIVELPSGPKVTLRDKLAANDKFTVQDAVMLESDPETGRTQVTTGLTNKMRNALLTLLITDWDVPGKSIPSQDPEALGELDIDDYLALADAVEPMLRKVTSGGVPNRPRPS